MLYALRDKDGDFFDHDMGDDGYLTVSDILSARKFSCPADAEAFIISARLHKEGMTLVPVSAEGIAVAQDAMHDEFMRGRG